LGFRLLASRRSAGPSFVAIRSLTTPFTTRREETLAIFSSGPCETFYGGLPANFSAQWRVGDQRDLTDLNDIVERLCIQDAEEQAVSDG
jgi:hypothetical protein